MMSLALAKEIHHKHRKAIRVVQDHIKGGARWALRYVLNAKIISGELRVVKKVELWHPSVPEDVWREWLTGSDAEFSMLVTKCCSKNPWCPPWGHGKGVWDDKDYTVKYPRLLYVCPGCGAEIQK